MGMYAPSPRGFCDYKFNDRPLVQGRSGTPKRLPRDTRTAKTPTQNGVDSNGSSADMSGRKEPTSNGEKTTDAAPLDEDFVSAAFLCRSILLCFFLYVCV